MRRSVSSAAMSWKGVRAHHRSAASASASKAIPSPSPAAAAAAAAVPGRAWPPPAAAPRGSPTTRRVAEVSKGKGEKEGAERGGDRQTTPPPPAPGAPHRHRRPGSWGTGGAGAVRGYAERPLRPARGWGPRRWAPPWPWGFGVLPKSQRGGRGDDRRGEPQRRSILWVPPRTTSLEGSLIAPSLGRSAC